jgi:hypothetical protein
MLKTASGKQRSVTLNRYKSQMNNMVLQNSKPEIRGNDRKDEIDATVRKRT